MMMKVQVRTMKPISWIGLRPQKSMKMKVTQYPGMRPATERIKLPTQMFHKLWKIFWDPEVAGVPKPMAVKMIDELSPRP